MCQNESLSHSPKENVLGVNVRLASVDETALVAGFEIRGLIYFIPALPCLVFSCLDSLLLAVTAQ